MNERNGRSTRRQFVAGTVAAGLGGLAFLPRLRPATGQGRTARLRSKLSPPSEVVGPGTHELPESAGPGAWLRVPPGVAGAETTVPLLIMLHGATRALPPVPRLEAESDGRGIAVLAPMAGEHTWDLMFSGRYADDVGRLDAALSATFDRVRVDPARLCLAGFSDGASYALSVGLQNGDLFSHLMAFSPGFIGPGRPVGLPRVFISHGLQDNILPIERTTARILESLELRGIEPRYIEFEGGHGVPPAVETAALDWFLAAAG